MVRKIPNLSEPQNLEAACRLKSFSPNSFLAAYIIAWLSQFVFPYNNGDTIKPETFVMAAKISVGMPVSLAPPVLASIYGGLGL